jgi:proteasome-associated ATPase
VADKAKERDRRTARNDEQRAIPGRIEIPSSDTQIRALALLDEILKRTPHTDPRRDLLDLLQHQLIVDERQMQEARAAIAQFDQVYAKLTAPANRIGTYLGSPQEGIAYVALGDSEFYTNIDPKLDWRSLRVGTRVKINEAYAIIGDLGYHPEGAVVKIAETLPDERLRVTLDAQGIQGRIILRSTDLAKSLLKPGDEVRLEPSMRVAIEHFQKQQVKDFYLEKIPQIPWSKIGGQEEAIRIIRDTIERPLLYPELYKKFGKRSLKGILLYGPPGCGKTLIGKATAYNLTRSYAGKLGKDVSEYFMYINGPRLLNMWLGETERMVREVFAAARERAKEGYLVFIFIDEADALLRVRSAGRFLNIANTVVPQFAAEMDGLVSLENVVVMLTSNRPDYIDPAILRPERIDRKVKVKRPDRAASTAILHIYLDSKVPLNPDWVAEHGDAEKARQALVDKSVEFLYERHRQTAFLDVQLQNGRRETLYWSDLLSGALLMSAVERAKDSAIRRAIDQQREDEGVHWEDMRGAIRDEFKENEIFPKTDHLEDWLKLLDYEPENVVEIKPAREGDHRRRLDSVV